MNAPHKTIQFYNIDNIMIVTVSRPQVRNALTPDCHFALAEIFDRFAADDSLHVAIITGEGDKAFCSGSDLNFIDDLKPDDMPVSGFGGLTTRFDLYKPVIAAINGDAIGGGLEIVMACDLAIAVPHARFCLPEPKVGLAASGGLHRLARTLTLKHAMKLAMTAEMIDAETAVAMGLINQVYPTDDILDDAIEMARNIGELAPLAIKASKQMILEGLSAPDMQSAFAGRYSAFEAMLASHDAKEGPRAFIEKRSPKWSGK
ncbi:enoyl-CoA hydratase-related protein [Alphaproteobacteria bacterium]|nr:enoyl-CoA hydratase-related protein [Alphaproteobacteria bacterium]